MSLYPVPATNYALSGSPALSGQLLQPTTTTSASFSSFSVGVNLLEFSVSTQSVVYTTDGSVPTATNGVIIPAGGNPITWSINKAYIAKFRSLAGTATIYGIPLLG